MTICVLDPTSGGKDSWTYCTAAWERDSRGDFIRFADFNSFEPKVVRKIGGAACMDRIIQFGQARKVTLYATDQRDKLTTEDAFKRHNVRGIVYDWTAASKPAAVERVRQWFFERTIALPPHETLKNELLMFEERTSASGSFTYGARGSGHDDFVSLLITAAMADVSRRVKDKKKPSTSGMGGCGGMSHAEREARPVGNMDGSSDGNGNAQAIQAAHFARVGQYTSGAASPLADFQVRQAMQPGMGPGTLADQMLTQQVNAQVAGLMGTPNFAR